MYAYKRPQIGQTTTMVTDNSINFTLNLQYFFFQALHYIHCGQMHSSANNVSRLAQSCLICAHVHVTYVSGTVKRRMLVLWAGKYSRFHHVCMSRRKEMKHNLVSLSFLDSICVRCGAEMR